MLERMTKAEITGWVSTLDEIHALLAASAEPERAVEEARSAVERLYEQMLRAEVRAVIGGGAGDVG
jgi:hypothetical protein